MTRKGDWFLTYTGLQFWPLDPRPEDIRIEDIAHALSNICRFGGHCTTFYSVAQHSVHVAALLPPALSLEGLMHDATEAYIGDMVRPLKKNMSQYQEIEENLWRVIAEKFELPFELDLNVKRADDIALMTERRDIVTASPIPWSIHAEPDPHVLIPWSPENAQAGFLTVFSWAKHDYVRAGVLA